ncbi:MAG: hypothetical protein JOZ16_16910 [Methylobacteriaceae bacterium]|nr:hypothetical protein [Methylobacteriaceae bacterium]
MLVRLSPVLSAVTLSCTLAASAALWASSAQAQSPAKQCADEWKSAKAGGTVPAGQKRADFIKDCRDKLAAQPGAAAPATPAAAAPANPLRPAPTAPAASTAAPAPGAADAAAKPKKLMSPGMIAFHEREKKCGEEWRANTDQIKAQTPGITWPKYLSACNKRLKAAGQ